MKRCIYTNVFTLSSKDPSSNKYIEMFFLWFLFLKKFGGLSAIDEIHVAMDTRTYQCIQENTDYASYVTHVHIHLYEPPQTLLEGMKQKYTCAELFQRTLPGVQYLYLDIDVLVYKPLVNLIVPESIQNHIHIATENAIQSFAGNILGSNYLADRVQLNEHERRDLQGMSGISAGLFGWHHESPDFADVFQTLSKKIESETIKYYTIEQPFFNEAIVLLLRQQKSVYTIHSEKIGYNMFIPPNSEIPFVLVNFAGEPGDEMLHYKKLVQAYQEAFRQPTF